MVDNKVCFCWFSFVRFLLTVHIWLGKHEGIFKPPCFYTPCCPPCDNAQYEAIRIPWEFSQSQPPSFVVYILVLVNSYWYSLLVAWTWSQVDQSRLHWAWWFRWLPRQRCRRRYWKEMQNESLYRVRECSVGRENHGWAASAHRLNSGKWKVILQAAIEKVDWSGDDGNMDHEEDHSGGAFGPRSLIEIW